MRKLKTETFPSNEGKLSNYIETVMDDQKQSTDTKSYKCQRKHGVEYLVERFQQFNFTGQN